MKSKKRVIPKYIFKSQIYDKEQDKRIALINYDLWIKKIKKYRKTQI